MPQPQPAYPQPHVPQPQPAYPHPHVLQPPSQYPQIPQYNHPMNELGNRELEHLNSSINELHERFAELDSAINLQQQPQLSEDDLERLRRLLQIDVNSDGTLNIQDTNVALRPNNSNTGLPSSNTSLDAINQLLALDLDIKGYVKIGDSKFKIKRYKQGPSSQELERNKKKELERKFQEMKDQLYILKSKNKQGNTKEANTQFQINELTKQLKKQQKLIQVYNDGEKKLIKQIQHTNRRHSEPEVIIKSPKSVKQVEISNSQQKNISAKDLETLIKLLKKQSTHKKNRKKGKPISKKHRLLLKTHKKLIKKYRKSKKKHKGKKMTFKQFVKYRKYKHSRRRTKKKRKQKSHRRTQRKHKNIVVKHTKNKIKNKNKNKNKK